MPNPKKTGGAKAAKKTSGRKATNGVVTRFISVIEQNCHINQQALIQRAKLCGAFGDIDWESHLWDVTAHYRHVNRGADGANFMGLYFTPNDAKKRDRHNGVCMNQPFADIAKAIVRLRQLHGGQALERHGQFIKVLRHLYKVLEPKGYDITEVTRYDFDAALERIQAEGSPATHYSYSKSLELIGDYFDMNGLAKARLDWVSPLKYSSRAHALDRGLPAERIEDAPTSGETLDPYNKLPSEEVIKAIAVLYQRIPKGRPADDKESADRICILITIIMVCTGLRASEALSLIAEPVQTTDDGSKFIRYYVRKQSKGDTETNLEKKTLLTDTEDLVVEVIDELLELTEEQRRVARYIFDNGAPPVNLPPGKDILSSLDILAILPSLGRTIEVIQWLKIRKVETWVEKPSDYKKGGPNRMTYCRAKDFAAAMLSDHWKEPIVPGNQNNRLELHEGLCLMFLHQLSSKQYTMRHAVQPITKKQLSVFLQGLEDKRTERVNEAGEKVPHKGAKQLSIFERYGLTGADGQALTVASHGFRHFINHLLDEGGAPDTVQAIWFGRKSHWQNAYYQHMTPAQRGHQLMQEVMDGNAVGYVASVYQILPADRRDSFLAARTRAVHDVGTGYCDHEFQQSSCERHLQCEAGCKDYLWVRGEKERLAEVQRKAVLAWYNLKRVQEEIAEEYIVHDSWLAHNQKVFDTLNAQLESMGVQIDYAVLAEKYLDAAQAGIEYTELAAGFLAQMKEGGEMDGEASNAA